MEGKMYNLKQAASIAIIGGADGPTSIYVAKGSLLTFIILYIAVPAILFTLAIFFLVRSIKKKQKARTIIFSILSGIFFLTPIFLILCPIILAHKEAARIEKEFYQNYHADEQNIEVENAAESDVQESFDYYFSPISIKDFSELHGKCIETESGFAGVSYIFHNKTVPPEDGISMTVDKFTHGSGLPVIGAEYDLPCSIENDTLTISSNEKFFIKDGILHFLYDDKEVRFCSRQNGDKVKAHYDSFLESFYNPKD
ncbi:MAG: sodium ion-translocating decarboxylase subunit beta [Treponema sp.]|nr:sodium ion-translocating decarboxylase subunit beta [Treponema sp.]